jgi:hypothetical protein
LRLAILSKMPLMLTMESSNNEGIFSLWQKRNQKASFQGPIRAVKCHQP